MKRYAEFVKNGKDEDFGRKELPEPLNKGKLYAIDVVPLSAEHWAGFERMHALMYSINAAK